MTEYLIKYILNRIDKIKQMILCVSLKSIFRNKNCFAKFASLLTKTTDNELMRQIDFILRGYIESQ